jgi:dynein heavy chain, axonemal
LVIQEVRLQAASKELNDAQAALDEKEAELRVVQQVYDSAMFEKQTLLDDAEMCKKKMSAASQLINGLAGEKIRWTKQSHEFKIQIDR